MYGVFILVRSWISGAERGYIEGRNSQRFLLSEALGRQMFVCIDDTYQNDTNIMRGVSQSKVAYASNLLVYAHPP